jgi:hypothetical protein
MILHERVFRNNPQNLYIRLTTGVFHIMTENLFTPAADAIVLTNPIIESLPKGVYLN